MILSDNTDEQPARRSVESMTPGCAPFTIEAERLVVLAVLGQQTYTARD